ncbi:hypothetical protein [Vibrio gallicus]|uniref:hypothetical protein n=1 Tax=Vibrio gallicus TaxID=190897 RepID=UPI0021C298FA|nr:hypothetical protein [Vibrio gallicus]
MPGIILKLHIEHDIIRDCFAQFNYPNVNAVLLNQDAATVNKRLNLIYKQCGQAHNSAFFHTQGISANQAQQQAQNQALALERMLEISWQLWRIFQLLFTAQPSQQALFTQFRQQLMAYKARLAHDIWLANSQAVPITIDEPITTVDFKSALFKPIIEYIHQQHWAKQLYTEQSVLQQYESGPSVRMQQITPTIVDRIQAMWQELVDAQIDVIQPQHYHSNQRFDGTVDAARGQLSHHVTWHNSAVKQYTIQVPTSGIVDSLSRSLLGINLKQLADYPLALSVWILTHFPCMEVSIEFDSTNSDKGNE